MAANLEFDQVAHRYLIDSKAIPSVTTILRDVGYFGGYKFIDPVHKFRGSAVHALCADLDAGKIRLQDVHIEVEPPWDKNPEYLKVAGEIPGYCEAFIKAKEAL